MQEQEAKKSVEARQPQAKKAANIESRQTTEAQKARKAMKSRTPFPFLPSALLTSPFAVLLLLPFLP